MYDKHHYIEEPCAGKLASTVLKTGGVGDDLAEFNQQQQKGKAESLGANSVVGAIALGSSIIKSLIDVASLFKADRTISVNKEIMDEETVVSKIRKLDNCCARKYYYPALFSPTSTTSPLTSLLAGIDSIRIEIDELLVKKKLSIDTTFEIAKKSANKIKVKKEREAALVEAETIRKNREKSRSTVEANVKLLNDRFDGIKKELATPIEGTTKMSLLRNLLRVEGVLEKIKGGAYTLKITAEGKGTNVITKFLWKTTLRHSAFVEARFQLIDSQGELVRADAVYQYASLRKSAEILK